MHKNSPPFNLSFIKNNPRGLFAVKKFTKTYLEYLEKKVKEGASLNDIIRSLKIIILYCDIRSKELEKKQKQRPKNTDGPVNL